MNADFADAHERHWMDAELLRTNSRLANADHLYGIAAECGLKALMEKFGMKIEVDGRPKVPEDRTHIMEKPGLKRPRSPAWDRYEAYRSEADAYQYGLPDSNPFSDWDVGQRYAHHKAFSPERVEAHRDGCELVRRLVRRYELEHGAP